MDKRMRKALREYQKKEEGITVILSPKELQLIKEAVEIYMKHHADEMMLFEYQMMLDDIEAIEEGRR